MRAATPEPDARLAIVMISLNEAHNTRDVLANIADIAGEVFLVDSYSSDDTVEIALEHKVQVVQRRFRGFGDQWNFAVTGLPITAPWTMKLDPDERLTDALKSSIRSALAEGKHDGYFIIRRLWFMGKPIYVRQHILRIWRTGKCRFSDVLVNEHPIVDGSIGALAGDLEHHDSPHLHHRLAKQNDYTTRETLAVYRGEKLAAESRFFGSALERRVWLNRNTGACPGRQWFMYLYCLFLRGAWRAGKRGFVWARLRSTVYRMREDKIAEMRFADRAFDIPRGATGAPCSDVQQFD